MKQDYVVSIAGGPEIFMHSALGSPSAETVLMV